MFSSPSILTLNFEPLTLKSFTQGMYMSDSFLPVFIRTRLITWSCPQFKLDDSNQPSVRILNDPSWTKQWSLELCSKHNKTKIGIEPMAIKKSVHSCNLKHVDSWKYPFGSLKVQSTFSFEIRLPCPNAVWFPLLPHNIVSQPLSPHDR